MRLTSHVFSSGSISAFTFLFPPSASGWMLGSYITGLQPSLINTAFSALIAVTMPALYIVLGSGWLMIKTEGDVFEKAIVWGKTAMPVMGLSLLVISISTPLVSETIANKWFSLPDFIGLAPIPITTTVAFFCVYGVFANPKIARSGYAWLVLAGTSLTCVMATAGLSFSLYPYVVLDRLTVWDAAAATNSLQFIFWGVIFVVPAILGYTVFVYWVFRGKAGVLSYGQNE